MKHCSAFGERRGVLGEGWNNGNNFAAGAIAPSLRGLTVQKTVSLFDGLRMAPYPVADDGHRNFVDISTMPDNVIDRIDVLRDGASSTYGADAVAGVVNLISKKEIRGLHANVSYGISSRGDGRERVSTSAPAMATCRTKASTSISRVPGARMTSSTPAIVISRSTPALQPDL